MRNILVVDDELNMRRVLKILFESKGYAVRCASNGSEALEVLSRHSEISLVVSDLKMPGMDGILLLEEIKKRYEALPFILISAYGTIELAVEAMKRGAVDFITKPFNKELIIRTVDRLFQMESLKKENEALRENLKDHDLIFRSSQIRLLYEKLKKIAGSAATILLTGESGSGKEVFARAIHSLYQREKTLPFISVNCSAVPESLFESELFGYRKGAFTGADSDFPGKVRLAEGGTLFLDEIGDLPLQIQPKLLRLIENRTIEPLGTGRQVDVRTKIICATNNDLERLVTLGKFREDLLYRINTFHMELPPLRERRSDIAPLSEYFLDQFAVDLATGEKSLSSEALSLLESYHWPGNVRELRNVIERMVVLSEHSIISVDDLPEVVREATLCPVRSTSTVDIFREREGASTLNEMEKRVLLDALESCGGNISAAARKLGITRNTMRYRLKKYRLDIG
jgi:DNA-binding NtrC family response regulator